MELIRGEGPHIFPRNPQDWIDTAAAAKMRLVHWEGQEFLLLDQVFVRAVQAMRSVGGGKQAATLPAHGGAPGDKRNQDPAEEQPIGG
jgi:hypothetical protein